MKKSLALALLAVFAGFFIYGMYRTSEIKKTVIRAEIERNAMTEYARQKAHEQKYNDVFGWLNGKKENK